MEPMQQKKKEMKPETRALIKSGIRWFCILLAMHLAGMLLYGLFISTPVTQMIMDRDLFRAHATVLGYGLIFVVIVSIIYIKVESSYVAYRKEMREAFRSEQSFFAIWKGKHLLDDLIKVGLYFVMQLPIVIFVLFFGYSLIQNALLFEQFYVINIGWYVLTGSAILGVLLDTLTFGAVFFGCRLLFVFFAKRSAQKDL